MSALPHPHVPAAGHIDLILAHLGEEIQLTDTQFREAVKSYGAIAGWLNAEGSPLRWNDPWLHPQGSMALDTVVRPLSGAEFDLDIVCLLRKGAFENSGQLFDAVYSRMKSHANYRSMIEPRGRCIRVTYQNDYHLDIVPATPLPAENPLGTRIRIPDLVGNDYRWKNSNPIGLRDWFKGREEITTRRFAEASVRIDPLRAPAEFRDRPPLRVAVQLMKRFRDLYFADKTHLSTPSIVLTILAGSHYSGGDGGHLSTLIQIVRSIRSKLGSQPDHIWNPANPSERITESWDDPERFSAFTAAIDSLWAGLETLSRSNGPLAEKTGVLQSLFGLESLRAASKVLSPFDDARKKGSLSVVGATGMLSTVPALGIARPVPGNTFHGEV